MLDFLTAPGVDGLRNWLATIGGLVALLIAANTYRRNVRNKREEQARLVYSKFTNIAHHNVGDLVELLPDGAQIGSGTNGGQIEQSTVPGEPAKLRVLVPLIQVTAIIHNGSKELIGPAQIQMVNTGRKLVYDTFSVVVGAIEPESNYTVNFSFHNADHPGFPGLGTTLIFRDASGQWWRRHLGEPIERVHDDPENANHTPAERAAWAANAKSWGTEPSPEPALTRRVRWHRYWRKRRGESPVP